MDEPTNSTPLFQNTDAQEAAFAPQQVPGSDAQQANDAGNPDATGSGIGIPSGNTPLIPFRGDTSQTTPIISPALLDATDDERRTDR